MLVNIKACVNKSDKQGIVFFTSHDHGRKSIRCSRCSSRTEICLLI